MNAELKRFCLGFALYGRWGFIWTGPDKPHSLRGLIWKERWFGKGRDYQGKAGKKAQKKNYWRTAVQMK